MINMKNILRVSLVLLLINFSYSVSFDELYQFGEDVNDIKLPEEDDFSTEEIVLKTPFMFYGQTYFSIYINTNGLLSFLTEIPYFYNSQFPLDYPTIAPFYSDVDLSEGGNIWYRESSSESTLSKLEEQIHKYFPENINFKPENAFIVTWDEVSGYKLGKDKENTFQVILAAGHEDSFIIFNYPKGGLQWLQGGGKTSGLPDAIAQVGFISEDKKLFTIIGSGTDQVRNLDKWSNTGVPGVWAFRVGKIPHGSNVDVPRTMFDNTTRETDEISVETCAIGDNICHSLATCLDYDTGFCCKCNEDFYGNGLNCLRKDEPIRVTGKVNGNINGIDIIEADLHSYVLSNEGRTYTAASRVQKEIGYDLQSLVSIGEGIAWMFAVPEDNVKNGFILTGGNFNRSVEINFPQTGHKAFVHQIFEGLDVFSNVAVSTTVKGSIPSVSFGAEIQVDAFQEEITKVHQGKLRARSNREFRIKGQTLTTPFSVETFIDYIDCQHEDMDSEKETTRLKIADNIFIRYDEAESIVRYSFSAKIGTLEDVDPCIEGKKRCGPNSQCIVERDTYRCVCKQGYDYMHDYILNLAVCMDMNECELARDRCDPEAICVNSPGSYSCRCREGFVGNGYYCEPELSCENANCHYKANCNMVDGQPRCQCNIGYRGNGFTCTPYNQFETENCHITQDCSPFASCIPSRRGFSCRCLEGYTGDGRSCYNFVDGQLYYPPAQSSESREDSSLEDPIIVDEEVRPDCVLDVCWCSNNYVYNRFLGICEDPETVSIQVEFGRPKPICDIEKCACPEGFTFNELYEECDQFDSGIPCSIVNNCHPDALCTNNSITEESHCICNEGFTGDGFSCRPSEVSCDQVNMCSRNAECIYDDIERKSICFCMRGYYGNGITCTSIGECNSIEDCDPNAQCLFDGQNQRFTCRCNSGYDGDGLTCRQIEDIGCNHDNPCDQNALCIYDTYAKTYQCQCLSGYNGNGFVCKSEEVGCHIQNDCGANAECIFIKEQGKYECICNQGYEGDGMVCRLIYTCLQNSTLCHEKATCQINQALNMYACVCQQGYTGDGSYCQVSENFEKDLIIISRGLSVLRMPIDPMQGTGYPIHVDPFMTAVGADIDCYAGRFYWTDIDSKSIRSSKYDGSEKKPLLTGGGIGFPEDVAVDWVARNVFWTDSTNNVVSVVTIEEGMKRTVIEGELVNPRGIAVHPGLGLLFWSDWDRNDPKIESAGMDGSNRKKLVSGSNNVLLPNSLISDFETGMICWADAGTHRIECVSMDGYGRRKVISNDAKYPFGLTLHYRSFYYSDWKDNLIHEVNKYTGEESASLHPPLGGSGKLYGIVAVPNQCPQVSNVCQIRRGNCDENHICLPNGRDGRTCSCTDDDKKTGKCNDIYY